MGCGGSRLKNVNPESIPARFRPILRRRIEEVRRRRRLESTKDESSKEELLRVNGKVNDLDDQKSEQREERVDDSVRPSEERDEWVERIEEKAVMSGGGNMTKRDDDEVMILDDDDTDESSIIFPGSPSFRIYYVDNGDDDNDRDNHDRVLEIIKEEGVKEKMQNGEMDALEEKEPGKKIVIKKRRSLRVIPRGGQAAVKNLLNVKGCYTPPCGARPDRAHLLTAKPQS